MTSESLNPRSSVAEQIATLAAVIMPFVGLIVAICMLWGWGITWVELVVLIGMYLATGFGITVGYHRLVTHKAFETFGPVKFVLAVLGSMSVQGPPIKWAAIHRRHHQYSDGPDDPHSPHRFGSGVFSVLAGIWHSHVGWMFNANHPSLGRYVRDLQKDKLLRVVSDFFGVWVLLGLLIPAALGGLITQSWMGVLLGFLWGGLARVFMVQHVTWSVNSICHIWGRQPYECQDKSRNNFIVGFLALGEGWHNNHHAFPTSARHGLKWWQFDTSYLLIRLMQLLGLAWRVQTPSQKLMAAKT